MRWKEPSSVEELGLGVLCVSNYLTCKRVRTTSFFDSKKYAFFSKVQPSIVRDKSGVTNSFSQIFLLCKPIQTNGGHTEERRSLPDHITRAIVKLSASEFSTPHFEIVKEKKRAKSGVTHLLFRLFFISKVSPQFCYAFISTSHPIITVL